MMTRLDECEADAHYPPSGIDQYLSDVCRYGTIGNRT